jgi:phage minor structural protein
VTVAELVWIYDLAGVQVAALADLLDLTIDERLQESETLTFKVRADDPKADYIAEDRIVRYETRRYRITAVTLARSGSSVVYTVEADALWIDLLGAPATTAPLVGESIAGGLDIILAGTDWTRGSVEADAGTFSLDTAQDSTVLAHIRAYASMTAHEVVFDTSAKTVSFVEAQGADNGLGFRYGRNLVSISRKAEPPLVTRLYAFGGEDLTVAAVSPTGLTYIDDFTFYTDQGLSLAAAQAQYLRVQTWTDNRYLLALNLYDAAVARLSALAQARHTYTLSVADLSTVTGVQESVSLGDTVRVDDAPTGISISTRVVRRVVHPLAPAADAIELGYLDPGLTSSSSSTSTSSSSASDMRLLVALNSSAINVSASQATLDTIAFGVSAGGVANGIFGFNLECVATGTGTLTITFWLGATQAGPTTAVSFVAGPVHIAVDDFLVGLTASASFYAKAQVTSGSGTIAVPLDSAHLHLLASGLAGGGAETSPTIDIAEAVTTTPTTVTEATPDAATQTPIGPSTIGESTDTTPATTTETVTAVTT